MTINVEKIVKKNAKLRGVESTQQRGGGQQ